MSSFCFAGAANQEHTCKPVMQQLNTTWRRCRSAAAAAGTCWVQLNDVDDWRQTLQSRSFTRRPPSTAWVELKPRQVRSSCTLLRAPVRPHPSSPPRAPPCSSRGQGRACCGGDSARRCQNKRPAAQLPWHGFRWAVDTQAPALLLAVAATSHYPGHDCAPLVPLGLPLLCRGLYNAHCHISQLHRFLPCSPNAAEALGICPAAAAAAAKPPQCPHL